LERQAKNKWGDTSRWMELSHKLPFGRMAEPDEIARMTVFACSPMSSYLSGTVINLDAGQIYADPL
jgi:NAD(P)-dependent dehydrogenase (short-subunit alcohol dehydrogenase family)